MKLDPDLEMKLMKATAFWPKDKPGLQEELNRIAKEHREFEIAWRKLWPLVALLAGLAIWLALSASGQI